MNDNYISDSELLRFLLDNGMIGNTTVAELKDMANREIYLKQHTCKIWLASDGYYKTKLKGDDGRFRLIKKKNKADVENVVIEYYKTHSNKDRTFKSRFEDWVERQRNCGRSDNTIIKYEADYKRFFSGYPIENFNIADIDEQILSQHILKVLDEKEIPWRAFVSIMGYVNGVFEKAFRDRLVEENPCKYLDLPIYRKYCHIPPVKTTRERTLSQNDIHTLLKNIRNPRAHNANRVSCFAIEMALYTGMRVGELAALMWEDIILEEDIMLIRRSEKYNRTKKESTITITKTGKQRVFPLTDDIKRLLTEIRTYETEQGWQGKFVFQDKDGRLTKSKISDAIRNHTMSGEFTSVKSIHAIRRTLNSNMRVSGVSSTIAGSLLGHSERVNDSNYTYDVSEMAEKRQIVTKVTKMII